MNNLTLAFAKADNSKKFWSAFEQLTIYKPEVVCDYLINWPHKKTSRQVHKNGYLIASYFAWKCGENRKVNLIKLLKSKDDYIRVVAASYLCFEDEDLGRKELKSLLKVEGDAGVWAALNLLRRGDKSVMLRALKIFDLEGRSWTQNRKIFRLTLQDRLWILLSNSCKFSKVELPKRERYSNFDPYLYKNMLSWWEENSAKITLHDPWLEDCKSQKVD